MHEFFYANYLNCSTQYIKTLNTYVGPCRLRVFLFLNFRLCFSLNAEPAANIFENFKGLNIFRKTSSGTSTLQNVRASTNPQLRMFPKFQTQDVSKILNSGCFQISNSECFSKFQTQNFPRILKSCFQLQTREISNLSKSECF